MSKVTYEIKTQEGDDVTGYKLVKKGAEIEFTLSEMMGYQDQMGNMLKEARAQMDFEIAKMKNVEEHHNDAVELVQGLDPLKQKAIQIWLNSKLKVDALGPQKDQLVSAIRADQETMADILEQTGLELPDNYKPVELNGTPNQNTEESEDGASDTDSGESSEGKPVSG